MRNRIMRTIIFFDLPVVSFQDRRNYTKFRSFLINEGFVMMQQSVYSKISLNPVQNKLLCDRVRNNSPKRGVIQMMIVTEMQFSNIEYVIGENISDIVTTVERLVVL